MRKTLKVIYNYFRTYYSNITNVECSVHWLSHSKSESSVSSGQFSRSLHGFWRITNYNYLMLYTGLFNMMQNNNLYSNCLCQHSVTRSGWRTDEIDGNVSVHPSLYKAQELLFYLEILADFSESWTWCLFTGFKPKMSLSPRSYLLLYRHFFIFCKNW